MINKIFEPYCSVEEVIQTCIDVAEENHYEREWVLDRFRAKFNSAKRKER